MPLATTITNTNLSPTYPSIILPQSVLTALQITPLDAITTYLALTYPLIPIYHISAKLTARP